MKIILNSLSLFINLSSKSLNKYSENQGEYKSFNLDKKKLEDLKIKLINSKVKDFDIVQFDSVKEELLEKIDKDFYEVINDEVNEIKEILEAKFDQLKIKEDNNKQEKIKLTEAKQNRLINKKIDKRVNNNKDNLSFKKELAYVSDLSNRNKNYVMLVGVAVIVVILFFSVFSNNESYDTENQWVKECLSLGFKKSEDVARCAVKQKKAHYDYLAIQNENERIKSELAQANQYRKNILQQQRRSNDLQTDQMLLNLSKDLMGLNNNNKSFNCITNIMGWSCN